MAGRIKTPYTSLCVVFLILIVVFCSVAILDIRHFHYIARSAHRFSQKLSYTIEYTDIIVTSGTPLSKGITDSIDRELSDVGTILMDLQNMHAVWNSGNYDVDIYAIANDFYTASEDMRDVLRGGERKKFSSAGSFSQETQESGLTIDHEILYFVIYEFMELNERIRDLEFAAERMVFRRGFLYIAILTVSTLFFLMLYWLVRARYLKQYQHYAQLLQLRLPSWSIPGVLSSKTTEELFLRLVDFVQVQEKKLRGISSDLYLSFGNYGNAIISASSQGDIRVQYLERYNSDLNLSFERVYEQLNNIITPLHVLKDFSNAMQQVSHDIGQCDVFFDNINNWFTRMVPVFNEGATILSEKHAILKHSMVVRQGAQKNIALYSEKIKKSMNTINDLLLRINNLTDMLLVFALNIESQERKSSNSMVKNEIEEIGQSLREIGNEIRRNTGSDRNYIENICDLVGALEERYEEDNLTLKNIEKASKEQFNTVAEVNTLKLEASIQSSKIAKIKNTIEHGSSRIDESFNQSRLNEVKLRSSAEEIRRIIKLLQEGNIQLFQNFTSINADYRNLQQNSESVLGESASYDNVH